MSWYRKFTFAISFPDEFLVICPMLYAIAMGQIIKCHVFCGLLCMCIWADSWQLRLAIPIKCSAYKFTNKSYDLSAHSYQLNDSKLGWSNSTRECTHLSFNE